MGLGCIVESIEVVTLSVHTVCSMVYAVRIEDGDEEENKITEKLLADFGGR